MAAARPEAGVITFTLLGHPPSPNRTRAAHWRGRATSDVQWRTDAYHAALSVRHGPALDHADVRVVFVIPDRRRRDPDNAIASVKPCLDGIVDAGILLDDSFAVVHQLSVTSEPGTVKAVRFEITELP